MKVQRATIPYVYFSCAVYLRLLAHLVTKQVNLDFASSPFPLPLLNRIRALVHSVYPIQSINATVSPLIALVGRKNLNRDKSLIARISA